MDRIFYPESILVIGVSERPDNLAKNIIGNLLAFQFKGSIFAVGRERGIVHGIEIVESVADVPNDLDLAVILTPARLVPRFVRQCGQKGIRRVVVESGGFSEFSQRGAQLEKELLGIIHEQHMRLVGPNCISVVNLEAGVCLPFGIIPSDRFLLGEASIISQSGGVCLTFMGMISRAGVGVNKAVSIGNKSDLDEADYLEYFLSDVGTRLVCLYLESISDGRRLLDIAAQASKPIVIHKANRSTLSHKVAFSHTAALADDDRVVTAAFKQTGILRADDFEDLESVAKGLCLPPVKGKNLVVISRSGGHAVTASDLAERHGFNLPSLPEVFTKAVREYFQADVISPTNPLDLGVIYDFDVYAQIVEESLKALKPDAVLLINTYAAVEHESGLRLARQVGEIMREQNLPVALCLYADMSDPSQVQEEVGYPIFVDIDAALRGLACSRDWFLWSTGREKDLSFSVRKGNRADGSLSEMHSTCESLALCQDAGVPTARWDLASTPQRAGELAEEIGLPVALKVSAREISHKSDLGGVAVGLADPDEVTRQAQEMFARFGTDGDPSFIVQEMVEGGVELLLGGKTDPTFGPVISLGIGGIFVELYEDVILRVAPLTRHEARSMIDELQGRRLLNGYRGAPPVDIDSIVEAILSISDLMMADETLVEFEINPLIATKDGVFGVDARALRRKPNSHPLTGTEK